MHFVHLRSQWCSALRDRPDQRMIYRVEPLHAEVVVYLLLTALHFY